VNSNNDKPVAVITGAAQGIGRRTAEVLAQRGYRIAMIDLRMPEARGAEAIGYEADVSDEPAVEKFAAFVYDKWGRADVLVNNAGISFIAPAETISVFWK
jgi:NAD(P)-dependent dehydrogenase (short-subunit alcohol dehydrogenase family)